MELEKAVELLKEMQENCKSKKLYKDEKAEAKAKAIEIVLKIINEAIEFIEGRTEVKHGECTFGLCDYECSELLLILKGIATCEDYE